MNIQTQFGKLSSLIMKKNLTSIILLKLQEFIYQKPKESLYFLLILKTTQKAQILNSISQIIKKLSHISKVMPQNSLKKAKTLIMQIGASIWKKVTCFLTRHWHKQFKTNSKICVLPKEPFAGHKPPFVLTKIQKVSILSFQEQTRYRRLLIYAIQKT